MSTPPNKRDQRRQDRLTNLAQSQATRRAEQEQVVAADDTEGVTTTPATPAATDGAVGAISANASVTGKPTTRPVGTTAGLSKTPTRPTTSARTRATGTAPGAKSTTRPVGAIAGKATTRPTGATGAVKATAAGGVVDDAEAGFVTKRDQRRETRRADLARIQEERRRTRLAQRRREQRNRWLAIGLVAVVVVLIGFLVVKMVTGSSATGTGAIVTGVPEAGGYGAQILCQSGEQFDQHIHANVQIVVNGKNEPLPAGVGIQTNSTGVQCYNWLHTHDTTGVVHIESPNANGQYLLGDFLAVWQKFPDRWIPEGKPQITSTSFFGMPIDKTHPVTVYVNKKKFTGDPNNLVLYSGENIWLEYGTQQVTPTNFDFNAHGVSP